MSAVNSCPRCETNNRHARQKYGSLIRRRSHRPHHKQGPFPHEPGSKLLVLGMVIPPLIGNPYNGYINPYYWVDDHPLLYGNIGSLDPSTRGCLHSVPRPALFPGGGGP